MTLVLLACAFMVQSSFLLDASLVRGTGRTSNSKITDPGNPCFLQPLSCTCVAFVAEKRGVSPAQARTLIARAVSLFASETTPSAALAVACLASRGTLRPGPYEDCVACRSSCNEESRPEVCELYCTNVEWDTSTNAVSFGAVVTRPTAHQYSRIAKATRITVSLFH